MTTTVDMQIPALVMPFYVVCDMSGSMNPHLPALQEALENLVIEIAHHPLLDEIGMVSVITFDNEARVPIPLAPVSEVTIPTLTANGN